MNARWNASDRAEINSETELRKFHMIKLLTFLHDFTNVTACMYANFCLKNNNNNCHKTMKTIR